MRIFVLSLCAGALVVSVGAEASPVRLPRSCRAAGLGPCFRAVDYSLAFNGTSTLVRDYNFADDLGNRRQTHQEITTSWTLRIRAADLYFRPRGKPLPPRLRGILPLLPTGGRRSMSERTMHADDKHGAGTYTCAGQEPVANTPSGFIRLDHLRPNRGGYALRLGSPDAQVLPDHRKITCTPRMVAGQYSGPTNLGGAFDKSLPAAEVTTIDVSRGQLKQRSFKVIADVAKTPPTACQADLEVCSQSLHWRATVTFTKWANCLVSFGAGAAECEPIPRRRSR